MKISFETVVTNLCRGDNGAAYTLEFYSPEEAEEGIWVETHSWQPNSKDHSTLEALFCKKVRVTLEVVE